MLFKNIKSHTISLKLSLIYQIQKKGLTVSEAKQMLRAKQVAQIYGVSVTSVWNYAKKGYFTPIKITDGVTLFSVDELNKFFRPQLAKGEQK